MQTPSSRTSRATRLVRRAALVPLVLALGVALQAQSTGTLAGRVVDTRTNLALGGARVTVVGTGLVTYADASGNYSLSNVPVGAQSIEFSYVGYEDVRQAASIGSGVTQLDGAFGSEAVRMQAFVIDGSLVGSARAINQQRSAASLTSIVAADEIGRFPDQNAAESLQRLPGVSLYRDQGEGRFVDLRGLNYIYTSVTLNGAKVASPEVGNRAIALDIVPADTLASLEVTKVSTPDMDGEGLGGAVNIKTKSPFDAMGLNAAASAQAIYSNLTEQFGSKFDASASNVFGDGKAGLLVSATWQERKFGSQNFEIDDGWDLRAAPGGGQQQFFLQDIAFRDYEITRTRYGASAALEFRPQPTTSVQFKGTYNRFTDAENRHVLFLPFGRGTVTALDANSATVTGMSRPRRDIRNREKDQELYALSTSLKTKVDAWTLDATGAVSRGREEKPAELVARFRRNQSDTSFRYTFSGLYAVQVDQLAGPSVSDPANYNTLDRLERTREEGEEIDRNFAVNARYDLAGASPSFLKFGAAYRAKDKESATDITRFTAPASFTFASLAGGVSGYPFGPRVPQISPDALLRTFNGNPAFVGTPLAPDTDLDDWRSEERILAGYAMGGVTLGQTKVTAGARLERTEFETRGNVIRGAAIVPTTAGRDYDHVLPAIIVRHDFNRRLVGRASYSTSLMRPAFGETAISRNIADADGEISAGNPALSALKAESFDASLEYYLPSLGVVSAAVFHKKIDNFSYAITLPGGDPAFPAYDLITYRNGSDGKVTGLELSWQQQLRMLPAPLDGLGFMVNATFADSEATYPTRPGETLPFIGQSDVTGNVALTYEKGRFFARVALNWRDAHLREDEPIGGDETGDRWIDDFAQLDVSTAFRFSKNFEAFAEMANLTNEPFRVYQRGGGRPPRFVQF
ncbi:MAG TPA: TonB-dependent receptor, partial [Opitutaceae bacterium]